MIIQYSRGSIDKYIRMGSFKGFRIRKFGYLGMMFMNKEEKGLFLKTYSERYHTRGPSFTITQ